MVRLVKGAYWDSEIKRAQVDGLEGYPVYTRKIYTDVSYLACAKKLLGAPDAVYPQFATHNAHTLSAIYHLAGQNYYPGQYEFQCLHGMGEPLYEEVTGRDKLNRPCRVYAPVGTHETLLAYLVRRLLENGANTSFVNRIADENVAISDLVADPVDEASKIVAARRAAREDSAAAQSVRRRAPQFDGPRSVERTSSGVAVVGIAGERASPVARRADARRQRDRRRRRARRAQSGRSARPRRHGRRSDVGARERRASHTPSPPRRSGKRRRSKRAPIASRAPPICSKRRCTR